jgi:hypothetical protein
MYKTRPASSINAPISIAVNINALRLIIIEGFSTVTTLSKALKMVVTVYYDT